MDQKTPLGKQAMKVAAIDASGLRPVIDSRFPLDRISVAFAHQMFQKHSGKIRLEF
jgi:NADPH:quinone reductase-like Zn-dependent oxidoreductase